MSVKLLTCFINKQVTKPSQEHLKLKLHLITPENGVLALMLYHQHRDTLIRDSQSLCLTGEKPLLMALMKTLRKLVEILENQCAECFVSRHFLIFCHCSIKATSVWFIVAIWGREVGRFFLYPAGFSCYLFPVALTWLSHFCVRSRYWCHAFSSTSDA